MLAGLFKLGLAGLAVAGVVRAVQKRQTAREYLYEKAHAKDQYSSNFVDIEPIDSSSVVPGAWAVPIYATKGPWPVRSWWPEAAGHPYDYSDEHNMSS